MDAHHRCQWELYVTKLLVRLLVHFKLSLFLVTAFNVFWTFAEVNKCLASLYGLTMEDVAPERPTAIDIALDYNAPVPI